MNNLRIMFEDLVATETDIRRDLSRAEGQRKKPSEQVLLWLDNVERIKTRVNDIENSLEQNSIRCFPGCYPWTKHSNFVGEVRKAVKQLQDTSRFSDGLVIADELSIAHFPDSPQPQLWGGYMLVGESVQRTLDKIWGNLMDPKVQKIGVFGLGGVGKTRAMMNIKNQIAGTEIFDKVIWVTLSKDLSLYKVQSEIAMQLNVYLPKYGNQVTRAWIIFRVLEKAKKFLIVLDDAWEPILLNKVGILRPNTNDSKPIEMLGSKLVVITRSRRICQRMWTDNNIEVLPLSEQEAWDLFVSRTGEIVNTPDVKPFARKMFLECDYLPILIISLSHAMRDEDNVAVWMDAWKELWRLLETMTFQKAMDFLKAMDEKSLRFLRFSYSRLSDDVVRNCFMYCAFFPDDYLFEPEELIRYWIGEDFISEDEDEELITQIDQGFKILRELQDANMLEIFTKGGRDWFKMHSLFRDLAINIIKENSAFLSQAGQGLTEPPYFWEWADLRIISLMRNHIEILDNLDYYCPHIQTLLLQDNPLSHISPSFLNPMPDLQLLDISYSGITELPLSLSELTNLRVLFLQNCKSLVNIPSLENLRELRILNLRGTFIKELPHGMKELVSLRSLNLSETTRLENVGTGVISSLSRLEELHLQGSRLGSMDSKMVANCLKELRCLKRLTILTLSVVGFKEQLNTVMCLQEHNLKRFTINVYGSSEDIL